MMFWEILNRSVPKESQTPTVAYGQATSRSDTSRGCKKQKHQAYTFGIYQIGGENMFLVRTFLNCFFFIS